MQIRIGILTVSDRSASGEREDLSGPQLAAVIEAKGWQVVQRGVVSDDLHAIQHTLSFWSDRPDIDVILTTGGTGFSPRDVTPEATLAVIERQTPGLAEAMRADSLAKTKFAMLSRGVAGIRRRTLIVNLPGSPKGAVENLETILPVLGHAVQLLREDPASESGHSLGTQRA